MNFFAVYNRKTILPLSLIFSLNFTNFIDRSSLSPYITIIATC
jgi:hypothetical protein